MIKVFCNGCGKEIEIKKLCEEQRLPIPEVKVNTFFYSCDACGPKYRALGVWEDKRKLELKIIFDNERRAKEREIFNK